MTNNRKSSIAVVGMAFRLPGDISTCDELWHALQQGENLISTIDSKRFSFQNYTHPRQSEAGKSYTFNAGVLSRIDEFDAGFFGITPREARQMDPQQRLLLETAWEALENGNQNVESLAGSNCAVYVGIGSNEHFFRFANDTSSADSYTMLGNCSSIAANRISYIFDFHGPSMSIDTACSSSLVALHQACSSIWNGEAPMAIAGGVNLLLSPTSFVGFSKASMLSPEGQCKSFAANGNGYVRSEGCVVLFLKPLAAAERDGDPIHAVIMNTGINSDGRTNGIALPNIHSQTALITRVHEQVGLTINDVDYIEAHGTGTVVGDQIEAMALSAALAKKRDKDNPLLIGSIKSNLGHLEVASGLAGVLKTILCLQHQTIPPTLHAHNPNPDIAFAELNIRVVDKPTILPKRKKPAVIGVNSFGFGGTNAHVILAQYKALNKKKAPPKLAALPPLLLTMRDEKALPMLAKQYLQLLRRCPSDYYDIAYALSHCRTLHQHGAAIYGSDLASLCDTLEQLTHNTHAPHAIMESRLGKNLSVAFVYSGNGSQWQGMAASLLKDEPLFIDTIAEIDALFSQYSDFSIQHELLATLEQSRFDSTEIAQPCIFAVQVATTRYLLNQGIQISAVTGHSIGEIAAAWACGALTLAQATEVVYKRSLWQGKTRGQGRMLAVALTKEEAETLLAAHNIADVVEIAALNSSQSITLAGELSALQTIKTICKQQGIFHRLLDLDYAFHTHHMDSIQHDLLMSIAGIKPQKNDICYISTVTGAELSGEALDAAYWWDNIRQPVRFNDAINVLLDKDIKIFIEIGPHPVLKPYIQESLRAREIDGRVFQTLKRNTDEIAALKHTVLKTWLSGAEFNKASFFPNRGQVITLPSYPWLKESHWLTPSNESVNQMELKSEHPLLGWRIKIGEAIWENHLDTILVPYLADHVVDGIAVMPAAGFAEMAIAASKAQYENRQHDLRHLDILAPMIFEEKSCRLVRFELQVQDGHFLIKSRPRHTEEPWVTHVVGRLLVEPALVIPSSLNVEDIKVKAKLSLRGDELYTVANIVGLNYGPRFQTIERLWLNGDDALATINLHADLKASMQHHSLYPPLLDACFQALIGLIAYHHSSEETFLPIHLGRLQLFRTTKEPAYIAASIVQQSKQSVLANFSIINKDGDILALISECRFKKAYFSDYANSMKLYATKAQLLAPFSAKQAINFADLVTLQQQLQQRENNSSTPHFASVMPLIDLMVSHFIYHTLVELTDDNQSFSLAIIDKINPSQRPFFTWCIHTLLEDGLLLQKDAHYTLLSQTNEINAQALWHLLLASYPHYLTELLLLGRVGLHLKAILQGESSTNELFYSNRKNDALKHFYEEAPSISGIHQQLCEAIRGITAQWPREQRLRVLDVGYSISSQSRELITLFPADRTNYQLLVADNNAPPYIDDYNFVSVMTLPASSDLNDVEWLTEQQFDLIIVRNYLHKTTNVQHSLMQLQQRLARHGVLLITEQASNRLYEFVLGTQPNWWYETQDGQPLSRFYSAKAWQHCLIHAGFEVTAPLFEAGASEVEGSFLLLAQAKTSVTQYEPTINSTADVLVLANEDASLPLYIALQQRPEAVSSLITRIAPQDLALAPMRQVSMVAKTEKLEAAVRQCLLPFTYQQKQLHIVWIVENPTAVGANDCAAIINLIHIINDLAWQVAPRLILVTTNAMPVVVDTSYMKHNPTSSIIWGLGRVIHNEYPDLQCKLIDIQGEPSPALAANFAEEIFTNDQENEVIVTLRARYGLRIEFTDLTGRLTLPSDYRLDFKRAGSLSNLHWFPIAPKPLANDEVMIKPHASGLNFRDLMYAMGLIPDEAVENGFLGTTLGMEFAGEIVAIGRGVTEFAIGDRVMGFAPASFGSSAITKAHAITALPANWSYGAAATTPIAFFTAYYAIHHLARLQPGERLLIHGAAGGVGIAAIQVAKHLGADIYVTAGSAEKRDFLRIMGIHHIYDSRTLLFADEILADTDGDGVDVVLNCLAGEAINANLSTLKPFGRFLELGKRDFFANSKMGLRPFRNNISYFGIDADQLLIKQPALCARLFREIMSLFEQEIFVPLPYREFSAEHINDTFRYMQQSRHIGKIIVNFDKPPVHHYIANDNAGSLSLTANASYLVTGGLSGFGLQTAEWLVKKGARHLILVSRSGASSLEANEALDAFKMQGVDVLVTSLDITDNTAVSALINTIPTNAPLKGIIHAAAVYDDALMQNLNAERLQKVLAPKVDGAWNLHQSTLNIALDFFVVYSSVTTLFGNPGQANYVAANTYLESLILYRRALGLPGLYAAWGPIADVGYLARNEKLKNLLAAKMGNHLFNAQQALQWLEKLMLSNKEGMAIANLNIGKMQHNLPAFAAPKFSYLVTHAKRFGEVNHEQSEDIRGLIADKSPQEGLAVISHLLTSEIAKILRLPMEKIDRKESLLNIGMDSLVGAELANAIEQRFSLQIPMLALSQGISVQTIAERILSQLMKEGETTVSTEFDVSTLLYEASLHGEELSVEVAMEVAKASREMGVVSE